MGDLHADVCKPTEALAEVITVIKSFLLIAQKSYINWPSFDACHRQKQKGDITDVGLPSLLWQGKNCAFWTGILNKQGEDLKGKWG